MIYETKFLLALFITLLLEVPLLLVLLPLFYDGKLAIWRLIFVGILASTLTLPYLWFVLPNYFNADNYILWGEIIITSVEAMVFMILLKVGFWRACFASISVNAISYFIGPFIIKYLLTIF